MRRHDASWYLKLTRPKLPPHSEPFINAAAIKREALSTHADYAVIMDEQDGRTSSASPDDAFIVPENMNEPDSEEDVRFVLSLRLVR